MGVSHLTGYARRQAVEGRPVLSGLRRVLERARRVLAALVHRGRTGEGQHVDLGMYQLGVVVMPEAVLALQAHGEDLPRRGNEDLGALGERPRPGHGRGPLARGQHAVGARASRARGVLGREVAADEAMAAVARWAADRDAGPRPRRCRRRACPPARCSTRATCSRASTSARAASTRRSTPARRCGPRTVIGRPYRMEGAAVRGPGPRFAEGNDDVLRALLGFPAERVAALRELAVVADGPTGVPTALAPMDLAVLLASRTLTRVDADYADRHRTR